MLRWPMKTMMTVLSGVLLGIAFGVVATPNAEASGCPVQGSRAIGETCKTDSDCESAECKKFTCVKRERPILKKGQSCKFNGDCCSNKCTWFKCE